MSLRRDNEFHSFVVRPTAAPPGSAPEGTEAAGAGGAVEATTGAGWTLLAGAAVRWLRTQQLRWWWRVLVGGAALLGLAWLAIVPDTLAALVPVYAVAFAVLVPVVAVVAWWENEGRHRQLDWDLPLALLGGLAAGAVSAFALYSGWLKLNVLTWQGALALAAGEELLKTLAVAYLLWSPRAQGVREGLRVGLVAALGFTMTQMALASYLAYHATMSAIPHAEAALFRAGIANMDHMLGFQLALQALGEVVWTATICAAIWRERSGQRFRVTPGLVVIVVAVLALHGAFNYVYANQWVELRLGGAFLPLVNLLLAAVSFALLRFFLVEERERAALGALPQSPLLPAFGGYLGDWRRRLLRWYADVQAASRSAAPAPARAASANAGLGTPPAGEPKGSRQPPNPPNPPNPPDPRTPPDTEWLK